MSLLRHRKTSAALLAPVVALTVMGLLAGCSTSTDSTPAADNSSSQKVDKALVKLLPASIKKSKEINFGAEWDTPPMIGVETTDSSKPVGIAVDMAAAMSEVLGVTPKWQNMQFPSQIPGLQSGNVDVLLGQVSITAEREKGIVDLTPFYRSTLSILVPAGNPEKLKSLADACGLTIGSVPGSILTTVVGAVSKASCEADGKPAIKVADYNGASGAISAVKAGTIDGWLDSTSNQVAVAKAQPESFTTVEVPVKEQNLEDTGLLGAAVSKANPGISKAIAGALKAIIDDGTYKKILTKYNLAADGIASDEVIINPTTKTPVGTKVGS
jgi:ABC-type amino acid transport substrate-binding protein